MKLLTGYTIWEIVAVMVISSVVITLAVSILFRIQAYFHSETRNYASGADFIVLSDKLKMDFDRAGIIQNKDNTLFLLDGKFSASYQFSEAYIVREESKMIDTFHLMTSGFHIVTLPGYPLLVEQVEFQVIMKDLKIPFFFSKEYDKQFLYQTDKPDEYKSE